MIKIIFKPLTSNDFIPHGVFPPQIVGQLFNLCPLKTDTPFFWIINYFLSQSFISFVFINWLTLGLTNHLSHSLLKWKNKFRLKSTYLITIEFSEKNKFALKFISLNICGFTIKKNICSAHEFNSKTNLY